MDGHGCHMSHNFHFYLLLVVLIFVLALSIPHVTKRSIVAPFPILSVFNLFHNRGSSQPCHPFLHLVSIKYDRKKHAAASNIGNKRTKYNNIQQQKQRNYYKRYTPIEVLKALEEGWMGGLRAGALMSFFVFAFFVLVCYGGGGGGGMGGSSGF